MQSWFKVSITESCVLGGHFHRLCRQFQRAFIAAGAPRDMALFADTYVLNDTRDVYFSPGCMRHVTDLLNVHNALPCRRPEGGQVTMVYGVPGADRDLLPGSESNPSNETAISPLALAR